MYEFTLFTKNVVYKEYDQGHSITKHLHDK